MVVFGTECGQGQEKNEVIVYGLGIYNYHSFFHIGSIIYQCKYCRNIDIDIKIKDVSILL